MPKQQSLFPGIKMSCPNLKCYAFPPFSILSRVLAKIFNDNATVLFIAPQGRFPMLLKLLIALPILLPQTDLLILPNNPEPHPLAHKLILAAWMVSGDIFKTVAFLKTQSNLSAHPGRLEPKNNTRQHQNASVAGVVNWSLIYIFQAPINQIADFFADCFSGGKSYSTIKKVNDQHFHQLYVRAIILLLVLTQLSLDC